MSSHLSERNVPISIILCVLFEKYGYASAHSVMAQWGERLLASDRLAQIRHYLYLNGMSGVHELARQVDASLATIRRDLQLLEEQGIVIRTRGCASLTASIDREVAFEARENHALEHKRAIADQAFCRIERGSKVFFDAGTTVLQLARRLRISPMPLTVFSNNIMVSEMLSGVEGVETILLGGRVRHTNRSLVGLLAEQALEKLWFDQVFLGASAVQPDATISTPDEEEARLNALMMKRTDTCFLLVDSTKFARHSTYSVGFLDQVSCIFTDTDLDARQVQSLRDEGHDVVLAGHAEGKI
ncbi:DeoR/GlpR family DNA-binding transcription regulator [Gluconobacter cerinus]|uniref:DeoR/GlpR family DNA-binding transcription regulator n=1 Tax=Gluconobacter cerinus TaxID=38307 RepID=UPI002010C99D|nr:DeoR/GlpR family DNA-binding transcription regulator [Gluconobacter cerinus]